MNKKQKKILIRILISLILLITISFIPLNGKWNLLINLIPFIIIGWDVIFKAVRNILHGQIFDENFLMSLATIGAFVTGEYKEGSAVMLFYQIGELFQGYAVGRSRKSISSLMDIRPDYANIEVDGKLIQKAPEEIMPGDIIIIKPGEKIPLDGIVINGNSTINTSALTGESVPREVSAGDDVISGCVNLNGLIYVKVTKEFENSTVSKILELVENSSEKKSRSENFITKFAKYYTPCVVIGAVLLAVIPPAITGEGWVNWMHRALTFLVISCPCALVISVPLSFFGGIGCASKNGILIKGSNYIEALTKTDIMVFDKTGTLTKGVFKVTAVHPESVSENQLIEFAAMAESYSDHPISQSIKELYKIEIDKSRVSNYNEISGHGVKCCIDGNLVCAGNNKLMDDIGVKWHPCHHAGTIVHVSVNNEYAGHIIISDEIKPESEKAIELIKKNNIRTVMLTGDTNKVGVQTAKKLKIDVVYTDLLPQNKVEKVEELIENKKEDRKLVFVGDGINDAPVLTRADIGISMGAIGSDAAIEASDIVLMDDNPAKIPLAIDIAKKTLRIVKQNIIFALSVKMLVLITGALGITNMWAAVFADVGVSVIAILNAIRALKFDNKK
ncbi:MAG: cadmium-translocating P-type ATPase [Oscillospiraceae bacterium]|nr:cadmium-translocating P-type ATPase [Oscillospiraceae bacterium]